LHRGARRTLAQIVEPGDQNRLAPRLVGIDREFEPAGIVERGRFDLAVCGGCYDRNQSGSAMTRY
jgi:hypothetical protein